MIRCRREGCGIALTPRQLARGTRHCSRACSQQHRSKYPPRRCCVCDRWLTPAQRRRDRGVGRTCSVACRGVYMAGRPGVLRAAAVKGNAARWAKYRTRMVAALVGDVRPVLSVIPPESRAAALSTLVKAMLKHRRLAYRNGFNARRYRQRSGKQWAA